MEIKPKQPLFSPTLKLVAPYVLPRVPNLKVAIPVLGKISQRTRANTALPTQSPPQENIPSNSIASRTRSQTKSNVALANALLGVTAKKCAARKFPLSALCQWAGSVLDVETGEMLEYRQLIRHPKHRQIWSRGMSQEVGRLAQGIPGAVDGMDTIVFIKRS